MPMKTRNRNGPKVGTNHSPRRSRVAGAGGARDEPGTWTWSVIPLLRTPHIRYSRRAYVNDLQEVEEKATRADAVLRRAGFLYSQGTGFGHGAHAV